MSPLALQDRLNLLEHSVREKKTQSLVEAGQMAEAIAYLGELGLIADMFAGHFGVAMFLFICYQGCATQKKQRFHNNTDKYKNPLPFLETHLRCTLQLGQPGAVFESARALFAFVRQRGTWTAAALMAEAVHGNG